MQHNVEANMTSKYESDRHFSKRTWLLFVFYGLLGLTLAMLL